MSGGRRPPQLVCCSHIRSGDPLCASSLAAFDPAPGGGACRWSGAEAVPGDGPLLAGPQPRQPDGTGCDRGGIAPSGASCATWPGRTSGRSAGWARCCTGSARCRSSAARRQPGARARQPRRCGQARPSACSRRAGSRTGAACGRVRGPGGSLSPVPQARVVLCAVQGTTDYVRFPKRPRVQVSFFEPAGGGPRSGEDPGELAARLLDEVRKRVPPAPSGRRRRQA